MVLTAKKDALLMLEDGSLFSGSSFGAKHDTVGEVVFSTGMVGYPESITDPSFAGQILCFTYPMIGNYGVPGKEATDRFGFPVQFESDFPKVKGVVVQEACSQPSHWASRLTLHDWLESEGVPGIQGVDTRALVTRLREAGVMMGAISQDTSSEGIERLRSFLRTAERYDDLDLVKGVSVPKPVVYGDSDRTVVLIDCGAKNGIARNMLERGYKVVKVPYNSSYASVMSHDPMGVIVSNGPGDPKLCHQASKCTGRLVDGEVPVLGICLGEQVVGISQGASTFKLKYGHRGQNKPCMDLLTGRGYVTSQNHGYAIDHRTLGKTDLKPWFVNADDLTIEGVTHASRPCMAVQFHPEATPGPYDTAFVFDRFVSFMEQEVSTKGEAIRSVKT